MVLTYVSYQKNKGQGHECFLTFFRPTNSKKSLLIMSVKLMRFLSIKRANFSKSDRERQYERLALNK